MGKIIFYLRRIGHLLHVLGLLAFLPASNEDHCSSLNKNEQVFRDYDPLQLNFNEIEQKEEQITTQLEQLLIDAKGGDYAVDFWKALADAIPDTVENWAPRYFYRRYVDVAEHSTSNSGIKHLTEIEKQRKHVEKELDKIFTPGQTTVYSSSLSTSF